MTLGPETSYRVRGGAPLHGTVFVQGAKNAALKMIAASLLTGNGHTVLRNVPPIEDVRRAVELAEAVGAVVEFHETERTLVVDASNLTSPVLPAEIARRSTLQSGVAPPGTRREPSTRSAWPASASRRGSMAGGCEKSASISSTCVKSRASAQRKPAT